MSDPHRAVIQRAYRHVTSSYDKRNHDRLTEVIADSHKNLPGLWNQSLCLASNVGTLNVSELNRQDFRIWN